MNWIDKLERKFGRHGGITNLTVYIIICYVIGYLLTYICLLYTSDAADE